VPARPLENIDIYMDTSDLSLLENKLSLRYRSSNGRAMYTMKSVGTIQNGQHSAGNHKQLGDRLPETILY
jgi:inorganic triphosphatase YgiF